MNTSLNAFFKINFGIMYFVILIFNIHARKMRFPASSQISISVDFWSVFFLVLWAGQTLAILGLFTQLLDTLKTFLCIPNTFVIPLFAFPMKTVILPHIKFGDIIKSQCKCDFLCQKIRVFLVIIVCIECIH